MTYMSQWTALAKLQAEQQAGSKEDRRHPRFVANNLNCSKGQVCDFSASGLRIVYPKDMRFRAGSIIELELCSPSGIVRCSAQIMWSNRVSRKQYVVGFRFMEPDMYKKIRLFDRGFDPLAVSEFERKN